MAARYWVGGTGNWTDTGHWSTTTGGGSGASVPNSGNEVVFDANSFSGASQTVTLPNTSGTCKSLDFSAVTHTPTFAITGSGGNLNVVGNITFASGMTFNFNSSQSLILQGTATLNLGGNTVFPGMTLQFGVTLASNYLGSGILYLDGTTFDAAGYNVTASSFVLQTKCPGITMGSGTWTGAWNISHTTPAHTITPNTSTVVLPSGANITSNASDSFTFYNLTATGSFSLLGGNLTFHNLIANSGTATFTAGKTYTFNNIDANGSLGDDLIRFISTSAGSAVTLSSTTVSLGYVDAKDMTAAGAAIPFDVTSGGVDGGNNTNWSFDNNTKLLFRNDSGTETLRIQSAGIANSGRAVQFYQNISQTRTYAFPDKSGEFLVGNDTEAAPAPTVSAPTLSQFYGNDTIALTDPLAWATVKINGTDYKIPLYQ